MTTRVKRIVGLALLLCATQASAQVYRWVDEKGTVHYSNASPPSGVKATVVDPNAKPGPPSAESQECHTVRCQGERMEERLARREVLETRLAAARAAAAPPRPRGLARTSATPTFPPPPIPSSRPSAWSPAA
jgi:hypothetical protein